MVFNPDEFLAKTETAQPQAAAGGFDPDAFLAKTEQVQPEPEVVEPVQDDAAADRENKAFADRILGTAERAGEIYDRFSGSQAARAGVFALAKGEGLGAAGEAALTQLGRPSDEGSAPTGKDIASAFGASTEPLVTAQPIERPAEVIARPGAAFSRPIGRKTEIVQPKAPGQALAPSPAGAVGLGIELALDPLVAIGGTVKLGLKAAKAAFKSGNAALRGSAKAIDILAGTDIAGKVDTTGKVTKAAGEAVAGTIQQVFPVGVKARVAKDFKKLKAIAEKHGIDPDLLPESVEFGVDSEISRRARVVAEGPGGASKIEKFNEGRQQIDNAIESVVENIGGGTPINKVDAGNHIVNSYNDGVKRFFDDMDVTFSSFEKSNPGLQITAEASGKLNKKLDAIDAFAKNTMRISAGAEKQKASGLLDWTQAIRNAGADYKQVTEVMQNIGREAFSKEIIGRAPVNTKKMREMYDTLREGITDTVRVSGGDEIANKLIQNNKAMSEFFGNKSAIANIVESSKNSPEAIFKRLVESGDSRKIESLKAILTPDQISSLKGAYLDGVIRRNSGGKVLYGSTINNIKRRRSVIESLFTPEEIGELGEVLNLGDRLGSPVLSSSASSAGNAFSLEAAKKSADTLGLETLVKKARKVEARKGQGFRPGKTGRVKALQTEEIGRRDEKSTNRRKRALKK